MGIENIFNKMLEWRGDYIENTKGLGNRVRARRGRGYGGLVNVTAFCEDCGVSDGRVFQVGE